MFLPSILLAAVSVYTIPSGTTYTLKASDPSIGAETVVNIEAGGVLDMNTFSPTIAGITGAGVVSNGAATLSLTGGPYRFSGLFKGTLKFAQGTTPASAFGLIIGGSNTLAAATVNEPTTSVHPLRFADGVAPFTCGSLVCADGPTLTVESVTKKPVKFVTGLANPDSFVARGKGTVHIAAGAGKTITLKNDAIADLTGEIGVVSGTLKFSNNGCDLSSVSGFYAENEAVLDFQTGKVTDVFDQLISGTGGTFYFRRPLELNNMNVCNAKMYFSNNATNVVWRNGYSSFKCISYASPTTTVDLASGGLCGTSRAYNTGYDRWGQNYYWNRGGGNGWGDGGSSIANRNYGRMRLRGGTFAVNNATPGHRVDILPGGVIDDHGSYGMSSAAGHVTLLDGGQMRLVAGEVYTSGSAFRSEATYVQNASFMIGSRGGTVSGVSENDPTQTTWSFDWPIKSGFSNGQVDGGCTFGDAGTFLFKFPLLFTGPCRFVGRMRFDSALPGNMTEGQPVTGYGDLVLGDCAIETSITSEVLELGSASGAKVVLTGAATVTGLSAEQIVLGASDAAANSALARETGGVLFFHVTGGGAVDGSDRTLKINGGLAANAAGATRLPVLAVRKTKVSGSDIMRVDFARYDNEKGVVQFEDYSAGLAGGADKIAYMTGWKVDMAENTTSNVLGLVVDSYNCTSHTDRGNPGYTLGIPPTSTLKIGNGVDPAVIILNGRGNSCQASIKKTGTIDFGTSEGIFVCHRTVSYQMASVVDPKISGQGGITVCSPNCFYGDTYYSPSGMYISNPDNDYAGGTHIHSAGLYVASSHCLSTGDVYVGGGTWGGSSLILDTAGIVITNAIHVAGYGRTYSYAKGALHFTKAATLTGPIELLGRVRIMADSSVTGTVSGVVSGDRLHFWGGGYTVTGANTYSNGTLIAKSSVVRLDAPDASLGTGQVMLDPGTLDMCGYDHAFHSIRGCGNLANTGSRRAKITLENGLDLTTGSISGKIKIVVKGGTVRIGADVTLGEDVSFQLAPGTSVDWCGAARPIRQLSGGGQALNGAYTESHPKGGIAVFLK